MHRWLRALPLLTILAADPAFALKPGKHRDLLEKACAEQHLPQAFCRRAGVQAYETDYKEWTDLAAHAQRELGEDACTAADKAVVRVDQLAREVAADVRSRRYEDAAIALGRAIHTIQDECAHHGMTNQEHAFLSMTDTCGDAEKVSPDVQPAALSCAQDRTRAAMAAVGRALAGTPWNGVDSICLDFDQRDSCAMATLPTPFMACDFLAEHEDWDGLDSTWHTTRVGDAIAEAFASGIEDGPSPQPLCSSGPDAIAPQAPHPAVTDRSVGCALASIACFGKVDDPGSGPAESSGGCSSSREPSLPWFGAMLAALALVLRRRANRTTRARPAGARS